MNQAIRGFYQITQTIKEQLLQDVNVKTVTTGDITDIDLSKQTILPLAHLMINNVSLQEQVMTFNVSILFMDIVDVSKDQTTDLFVGNNNEHDVLNTQLAVANKLVQVLRMGTLYKDKYQLEADANCEPFYDRFENQLAGWAVTFDVLISNDIDICS